MPTASSSDRLSSLTRQEAMVLYWKCKGINHEQIGRKLGYGRDRVDQLMSSIYRKLGFSKSMHWTERVPLLSQVFCSEFAAIIGNDYGRLESWPLYGVRPAGESVSAGARGSQQSGEESSGIRLRETKPDLEMLALVNEDERHWDEEPEVVEGEAVADGNQERRNTNGAGKNGTSCFTKALAGLGLLALVAGAAGAAYYFGVLQGRSQAAAPATDAAAAVGSSIATPEPPAALPSQIPTEPPTAEPSATPFPSNTPYPTNTPKPSVSLPFADSFSNGINPPWSVYSGKWLTTDTGATITIAQGDPEAGALLLDDPSLSNYHLRVRVHSPGVLSACQGDLGVVVRYQADRDQNLMYFMNSASRFYWGYTDSLSPSFGSLTQITDVVKANIISDFIMELEASGNRFTAWIDGAKQDSFSLTGYETGGVALVPVCGCPGYCPSFSDVSLNPIP